MLTLRLLGALGLLLAGSLAAGCATGDTVAAVRSAPTEPPRPGLPVETTAEAY